MTHHAPVHQGSSIEQVAGSIRRVLRTLARQPELPPAPSAPADPTCFKQSDEGCGFFGCWILDDEGLPAYRYDIDQYEKLEARYPNTEGVDRRDHWHQIGNDRVTALASNDGIVQLYLADRGGVFLNRYEVCDDDPPLTPIGYLNRWIRAILGYFSRLTARRIIQSSAVMAPPRGAAVMSPLRGPLPPGEPAVTRYTYGGGFGYVDDGTDTWATAFRYRPAGSDVSRVFGIGYYETGITHRNIRVSRRTYAPHGNDPLLLSDVILENQGDTALDLRYYEYWDVNVLQLKLQWLRTGLFAPGGDAARRQINDRFAPGISREYGQRALRFHQRRHDDPPQPDELSGEIDTKPADVFLADLSGQPDSYYVDKFAFFGKGGARKPDAVQARRNGEVDAVSTIAMPYCMVFRRDVHLEPKQSIRLRFAYGAVRPDESLSFLDAYQTGEPFVQTVEGWKHQLVYFSTGSDPALQREMAWHASNLLSATVYNEFYDAHLTPQGSAYLYLHGVDGAPRDQSLFVIPLVYVRPDLAQDVLRLIMSLTHADTHAIPYSFAGHGFQSDGMSIHAFPSDLDLFFLLALSEYLAATGDLAFLDADVPCYRPGPPPMLVHGATVLDHVRQAFGHLIDGIKIGEHGLLGIGDGDWNDGVVFSAQFQNGAHFYNSRANGESIPNSQMALYVLPRVAELIRPRDAALADGMLTPLPKLRDAVMAQWLKDKGWFTRAILRDRQNNPIVIGTDQIYLEPQPWALIGDLAVSNGIEAVLVDSIRQNLDRPSSIGAPLVPGGQVWPAVSQLLTWGYTRHYPQFAWDSLKNQTFANHATAYPKVWYNIWSGPDGICTGSPTPGCAWASEVTPMTDFPVMNANQDAMALTALIRVCGIEPASAGTGLIIAPKAPPERFVLDTRLLRLDVKPGQITGEYRAAANGALTLYVRLPENAAGVASLLDGQPNGVISGSDHQVEFPLTFTTSQTIRFEVTWQPGG